MTIFSPHFTVVVVLPPGDHDRFLDAARGPANLYLPMTHVWHTRTWLQLTGYNGLPTDTQHTPSLHALLGAHRHVAQLMDGKDACWWRDRRAELLGLFIPKETPLTTSCICQMVLGVERVPHGWFSIPRLLVWDEQPRPETAYARVRDRLDVDGVALFYSDMSMDDQIRMALFSTPQLFEPAPPRAALLSNGWSVSAFPFSTNGDRATNLLPHMAHLFPCGGAAALVNATQGTRVTTETVLDGQWSQSLLGECFGPEHHDDPFKVADYAWKRTTFVLGQGNSPMHNTIRDGLERLCNPDTEIHRPF